MPRSGAEALKWWRAAAEQGDTPAQFNIGVRDLAASNGARMAIKNRDALASRMTQGQIDEAQKFTREWKPVAPQPVQAQ